MKITVKGCSRFLVMLLMGLLMTIGNTACSREVVAPTTSETPDETTAAVKQGPVNTQLWRDIDTIAKQSGAVVSVYANFPDTSVAPFVYNPQPLRSASMIKIFILATLYDEEQKGQLTDNQVYTLTAADQVGGAGSLQGYSPGTVLTVSKLAEHMITESDNTATNILIDIIGMERINQYIQDHGYGDTRLQRKMMDDRAVQEGRENYTSAQDLGTIFTLIYQGKCVSPAYDQKMVDLLLRQEDTECFPAALPDTKIAHKTGELVGAYHDGGIIYSDYGNYILCVLTDQQQNRSQAIEAMKQIAQLVNNSSH